MKIVYNYVKMHCIKIEGKIKILYFGIINNFTCYFFFYKIIEYIIKVNINFLKSII